jgi:hypothetical protein
LKLVKWTLSRFLLAEVFVASAAQAQVLIENSLSFLRKGESRSKGSDAANDERARSMEYRAKIRVPHHAFAVKGFSPSD